MFKKVLTVFCMIAASFASFDSYSAIGNIPSSSNGKIVGKYYISCEIADKAYIYDANDYSFDGVKLTISYKKDGKSKTMEIFNAQCVIKPNISMREESEFSAEEIQEFKSLKENTGKTYQAFCAKLYRNNMSEFEISKYVFNQNQIAFAENKDGIWTIYKIINYKCAIDEKEPKSEEN